MTPKSVQVCRTEHFDLYQCNEHKHKYTNKRAHCAVVAAVAAAVQSRKKSLFRAYIAMRELKRRNNQVPPISYTKAQRKKESTHM